MAVLVQEEDAQKAGIVLFSDPTASLEVDTLSVVWTSSVTKKSTASVFMYLGPKTSLTFWSNDVNWYVKVGEFTGQKIHEKKVEEQEISSCSLLPFLCNLKYSNKR